MTSEIRTNSLTSRAGLSTVTLTDSGPMFSGITTFVDNSGFNLGTGSSIFTPASNTLTFGTNSKERIKVDSNGRLLLGTVRTYGTGPYYDDICINNSDGSGSAGGAGIDLISKSDNYAAIVFSNESQHERGYIKFEHNSGVNKLRFGTLGTDRWQIYSGGNLQPASDSAYDIGSNAVRVRNVYADTYYGSGANLTSLPAQATISNNADNRVITGGSGVNLNGEANVQINSSGVMTIGNDASGAATLGGDLNVANTNGGTIVVGDTGSGEYLKLYGSGSGAYVGSKSNHPLMFFTNDIGNERLRIDTSGRILIGTTQYTTNKGVVIYGESGRGADVVFQNANTGTGTGDNGFYVGNGTGAASYVWNYENANLHFATNNTERLLINSNGRVNIGDTNNTNNDLDYCRLSIYGQTSQNGTNKNLNLLNLYNYGSGNVGDITGIGLGAAASPDYTKASLAFIRTSSYGRGDLIFCVNAEGNANMVTESDEHLRLTSTGALALGISTPQENSGHYHQLQIGLGAHFYGRTDDTPIYLVSNGNRYGTAWRYTASTTASQIAMGTNISFQTAGNGTAGNTISFTERLKIANGGAVEVLNSNFSAFATSSSLYGANTANSKGFYWDRGTASCQSSSPRNTGWSSYYINKHNANGGSESRYIDFWEDANQRGSITLSGSGINYGSNSDYRLKKDDVAMTDGISRIKQLRPIKYKWIEGNIDDEGFFAHEAQAVVPVAVEGTKDQVVLQSEVDAGTQREDRSAGEPIYQTMDNSKLVPVLTASIKELITKVETLEQENIALRSRVTNLEGN